MEWVTVTEARTLTGLHPQTLYKLARTLAGTGHTTSRNGKRLFSRAYLLQRYRPQMPSPEALASPQVNERIEAMQREVEWLRGHVDALTRQLEERNAYAEGLSAQIEALTALAVRLGTGTGEAPIRAIR